MLYQAYSQLELKIFIIFIIADMTVVVLKKVNDYSQNGNSNFKVYQEIRLTASTATTEICLKVRRFKEQKGNNLRYVIR